MRLSSEAIQFTFLFLNASLLFFILYFLPCLQALSSLNLKLKGSCNFVELRMDIFLLLFAFIFILRVLSLSLSLCLLPFSVFYTSVNHPVYVCASGCVCMCVQLVVLVAAPPFFKTKHFVELNSTSKEKPVGVRKSIKTTCYFLVPSNRQKWRWFSVATPPAIYCRSHLRSPALFLAVSSVCNICP